MWRVNIKKSILEINIELTFCKKICDKGMNERMWWDGVYAYGKVF